MACLFCVPAIWRSYAYEAVERGQGTKQLWGLPTDVTAQGAISRSGKEDRLPGLCGKSVKAACDKERSTCSKFALKMQCFKKNSKKVAATTFSICCVLQARFYRRIQLCGGIQCNLSKWVTFYIGRGFRYTEVLHSTMGGMQRRQKRRKHWPKHGSCSCRSQRIHWKGGIRTAFIG